MIVSENVSKIVSLCDKMGDDYLTVPKDTLKYFFSGDSKYSVPKDKQEASQYFPNNKEDVHFVLENGWFLYVHHDATVDTPHFTKRLFHVDYSFENEAGDSVQSTRVV